MPKWTDYTIKTDPADKDEVMILDTAGKANKRLGLSALSDWVIGKITNKVFENLQTQNKTILGALNELNSNSLGTVGIPYGDSDKVDDLLLKIASAFSNLRDGIYNISGNWTNHILGYSSILQAVQYDNTSRRLSGIIFAFDGNGWTFVINIKAGEAVITKKYHFIME